MDSKKLAELQSRLEYLDERWTYRIRPDTGGAMIRPSSEELDRKIRDLANYTIEIKNILRELIDDTAGDREAD